MNKTEQVYEQITKWIFDRELLPGQRLVERDLASRLKLSKTPVREALLRLREDGLANGNFNNGVYVTMVMPEDALEILDIREALEGLAARRAAEKAQNKDLAELRSIVARMEHFLTRDLSQEYAKQDLEFHFKIADIAGNPRIHDMLRKLGMQFKILMISTMKLPGRGIKSTFPEHQAICDAIVERDPASSEEHSRRHIINIRKAFENWLV